MIDNDDNINNNNHPMMILIHLRSYLIGVINVLDTLLYSWLHGKQASLEDTYNSRVSRLEKDYNDSLNNIVSTKDSEIIALKHNYEQQINNIRDTLQKQITSLASDNARYREQIANVHQLAKQQYALQFEEWREEYDRVAKEQEKVIKEKAIQGSRSSIRGSAVETFAVFLENFPVANVNPSDVIFVGNMLDFIVFNGVSDYRDGVASSGSDIEIVFVEVKTNKSRMSKVQKAIQNAIEEGRVRFELFRVDVGN